MGSLYKNLLTAPSMTTGQRNALTARNGDFIYNTTVSGHQMYRNGSWVTIPGSADTMNADRWYGVALAIGYLAPADKAIPSYDNANTRWDMVDGSGLWTAVSNLASNATTTGQSLIDSGLTVPVIAAARYEFEVVLHVSTSAVATGTKYGLGISAGSGAVCRAQVQGTTSSTTTSETTTITAPGTATNLTFLTSASINGTVIIKGFLIVGNADANFTLQHLKVTSGTSTINFGSTLKVRRTA